MEAWDAIAAAYAEHVAPGEQPLSATALRLVGLRAGETLLDVAAGPGGLGLAAARLGATVLATDWAPQMVAQFEARARAEGLTNVTTQTMDAHALDLEDDRFDVVGSQFGVMLVPDQPLALREMVRVTRPGGRVLMVAYGAPAEYEALQLFISGHPVRRPRLRGVAGSASAGVPDLRPRGDGQPARGRRPASTSRWTPAIRRGSSSPQDATPGTGSWREPDRRDDPRRRGRARPGAGSRRARHAHSRTRRR